MDCLFCKKPTSREFINKSYAAMAIWRCRNCSAQFTYNNNKLHNTVFFRNINENPFTIQMIYPNSFLKEGQIIVTRHAGRSMATDSELFYLPFNKGLTPANAATKLQFWLTFS